MGASFGRELKRILIANGCTFVRHGKGDHEIWFSPLSNRNVTVDAGTENRLTANGTLKQAGINRRF